MSRTYVVPPASDIVPGQRPTVSVVIPAYQAADVIAEAIESVLAQTLQPDQIVICDDGSTDDLASAVAPYLGRVEVFRQPNGGEAAAKNTGVRMATGELIAILDADDVFLPERLEALCELAAARPDLDLITTDAVVVVNGQVVRRCFSTEFEFDVEDQRSAILQRNFLPFVAVRRDAFLAVGGFDESMRKVPDWDCWIRMILAGSRAGMIDEPLAEYRLRATNVTSDRLRLHEGRLETLEKAARRDDLSAGERAVVATGLAAARREVLIRRASQALLEGSADARRRCVAVVRASGVSPTARAKGLLGVIAPRVAGRVLAAQRRRHMEVAGGIRVRLR